MNPWVLLILAGMLEVVWAMGLKMSDGFSRMGWTAITAIAAIASFWLLALAMKELPAGTAYAVWTGIGAVGVALLGITALGEAATPLRLAGIALIISGIAALKLG
ncbi:QacE family quaternary ammonium compound efflux SMR transporter [Paracoccus suum]|uniref:Guanidinium exporter n=1 Tax=Paracoccus suum TaxID=2259340 RepID=A0A344PHD3_9RHOB|nr:multidrug efflux SMR transporter [Paracoccus suum]AXC48788.1 QacE family quaternary ammonium compound efflux SMR transporter [Paracoccus suum]